MRNFKRFLTLALAMVMLVSAFAMGTSAAKFTDVDEENEYLAKAVNLLSYVGVTKGTSETTFGTEELVTREQMAAFIYRLVKKGQSVETGANTSAFTDLEDPTFFYMVSWANNQGIIKGTSATTFDPKGSITLQDAYTMLVRTLGYEKEETLPYPFGYIDVAEGKNVALGEGLDSTVGYEDALTRGDVAVLLYNAFFAETGVAETKQVEREIGSGENATWVLETVTEYPTFCEKYFDVLEVEYQAVATPNYVFNAEETTEGLGYEAIEFVEMTEDDTDAPDQVYVAFEDLGIDGEANDYIMSYFKMFVTLDDDDEIEEILYVEPLMVKKTVTELKLGEVTTNNKNSYFDSEYSVKRLNGKVTFDGETAYFYAAPYSYITPKYASGMNDEAKYDARNEKNLQFIGFEVLGDVEDGEYAFTTIPTDFVGYSDEYHVEDSATLVEALEAAFVGGLYEADVYDVDGDGIYDYINYMPYSAYFVNTDEDYTFYDDESSVENEVYTGEAVLAGVEFKDGDYVVGYFNADANYIKAAAVVAPVEGKITKFKSSTGVITLNGEKEVSVVDGWKFIDNYTVDLADAEYNVKTVSKEWNEFAELLKAGALDADDAKFYVYNDVLLYQDGIDNFVTFAGDLLIVTDDEEGDCIAEGAFNPTTGKTTYVHVWVDGETKYVPINEEEMYPEFTEEGYKNRLATYTVENDLYVIELLGYAEDEDGEYVGLTWLENLEEDKDLTNEENEDIQAYDELADGAYLVKRSGDRYRLRDGATSSDAAVLGFEFILNENTVILVKNTYTDDDGEDVIDWVELKASDIKETVASKLENISYIVANNVDRDDREFLLVLYAEVNGAEFELSTAKASKKNERIVKMMDVEMNEDGKYYAVYDLFNPYTGALVENVAGTSLSTSDSYTSKFNYGDIVEVSTDNKVMDKTGDDKVGSLIAGGNENENVYLVTDYIASENCLEIVNVPDVEEGDDLDAAIEASEMYRVDVANAKVTIIGHQSAAFNTDMVRWGSIKVADIAKLNGSDKSYLALNANYFKDDKAAAKTVYAQYVKAYVDVEWNEDRALDEDDYNGEANFIVVIANTSENLGLCYIK